jgi:CRISPR-associated protein Cmr2
MTNWKNKILAYLHDPPHKPFRIAGHEDARGPLLRHLGLFEQDVENWEQDRRRANPDWQAAAADRFPFPNASTLFVDWKNDGELEFRHPLSGTRFLPPYQPRERSAVGESWVEGVMHGIPTDDAGWMQKWFRVWRLWPERCAREKNPLLAYLVADTRIPDHTLWHHNGLVSALEAVGPKPAFLLFQIGPVQDFIAQARKMLDLWSGSYLLSLLISKALATIALRVGADCIVYPNLRGVPLLDWWWSRERGLFPDGFFELGKGRLHRNELLVPSLPNRFLALVPSGDEGQKVAAEAKAAVEKLWTGIADAVHAQICTRLQDSLAKDKFHGWDYHWQQQVRRFPVVDFALHEWLPERATFDDAQQNSAPPLFGGWRDNPLRHAVAWREMIPSEHRESWHGSRNDAFAWSLHYATTDWKFGAAKNARGFAAWPVSPPGKGAPPKDQLNGRDEVLGGAEPKAFWDALREAYDGAAKGDFKGSQLYGAISVIKRLWPRAYLGEQLGWKPWKPGFESVQDIAVIERDLDALPGEPLHSCGSYAVLCMDGDDMGQWVSGVKTPPLEKVLARKAWDYFQDGKNGRGGWKPSSSGEELPADAREVRRPLSPGFHAALSEAISNFGLYCAGQVVEAFDGQVLYSGGDDVLAMLPATSALDCALALQCAFRGELPNDAPAIVKRILKWEPGNPAGLFDFSAPGFITCKKDSGESEQLRPNWPLMLPGPKATASVGIAIGHVRSPMQDTIQAARDAETAAKKVTGKGAFCLSILKRSGEAAQFAASFRTAVAAVWAELEANEDKLSSRFPYRLLQLLKPLLTRRGTDGDEGWEKRWTGDLVRAVEAELRHVHYQQNESGQPSAAKLDCAHQQSGRWTRALIGSPEEADAAEFQPALSPRAFVHFWMAWAFLKRLGNPAGDHQ